MPIAPYDPAAGGPSQAAMVSTMQAQNTIEDASNKSDRDLYRSRLTRDFTQVQVPQLESSLGSSGQFYSTAARQAEGRAQTQYQDQYADLGSAFDRAHMALKRNEAFAAIGLIL